MTRRQAASLNTVHLSANYRSGAGILPASPLQAGFLPRLPESLPEAGSPSEWRPHPANPTFGQLLKCVAYMNSIAARLGPDIENSCGRLTIGLLPMMATLQEAD